jgi:pyrroline-5-carboxylate reductase
MILTLLARIRIAKQQRAMESGNHHTRSMPSTLYNSRVK